MAAFAIISSSGEASLTEAFGTGSVSGTGAESAAGSDPDARPASGTGPVSGTGAESAAGSDPDTRPASGTGPVSGTGAESAAGSDPDAAFHAVCALCDFSHKTASMSQPLSVCSKVFFT